MQTLISYTSFNDESGETASILQCFKRWLWAIVEKMTPMEKQDLVYFWTGEKIAINTFVLLSIPRASSRHLNLHSSSVLTKHGVN